MSNEYIRREALFNAIGISFARKTFGDKSVIKPYE